MSRPERSMIAVCGQCEWPTPAEPDSDFPARCRNPKCRSDLAEADFKPLEEALELLDSPPLPE